MAIMVPSFPYGFKPESHEDEMFYSLKNLPDDYYIFYSFKLTNIKNGTWKEKEIDFVIYNKNYGLMFVEAKAGQVFLDRGIWKYGSGKEMKDPFKQADDGRWQFYNRLKDQQRNSKNPIVNRCRMHMSVWFPGLTRKQIDNYTLPQNARKEVILTLEDVDDPKESIERIFSLNILTEGPTNNQITDADHKYLIDKFLCPSFNILPSKSFVLDDKRKRFDAMLEEQYGLLNYLEFQRNAVINGAAGTGKTMIALEKARRHSVDGDTVLFLCFNVKLKEYLETTYPMEGVAYYTIDAFACKTCGTPIADYNLLIEMLELYNDRTTAEEFPYTHIIIDEGQDFGQKKMHADEVFKLLEEIAFKTEKGTFYVFYDKLQLVQSEDVPEYIKDADCKLTLYKNCRNTKRIAETSFKVFDGSKKPKLFDGAMLGDMPTMLFATPESLRDILDKEIGKARNEGINDIQILTCSSNGISLLNEFVKNDVYKTRKNKEIPFTTCRKFKGLEAEKIILIDVDNESIEDNEKMFYVGTSRAKLELTVIATLSDSECRDLLSKYKVSVKRNDPFFSFAKYMGCKLENS